MKKKLIEVALPLEAINKESAREKSIRHGHPSTLHLWWARRPLAACRAVLFASLVDDPSSLPEQFPTEADQDKERQRLFRLIEKLVLWENSNNRTVLDEAHAEILKSTGGHPPPIYDPFCGGGSIPLEAQRLGLEARASDLNPVAVLISKALVEIPSKFAGQPPVNPSAEARMKGTGMWTGASGLADDVRYYGKWMRERAAERIGDIYPRVTLPEAHGGGVATVIASLWARTVKCPNPACGAQMPMVRSFLLSTKPGKKAWVRPAVDHVSKTVRFEIITGSGTPPEGTKQRGLSRCLFCGNTISDAILRLQAKTNGTGSIPMAIVAEGQRGRIYLPPESVPPVNVAMTETSWLDQPMPDNARWFSPPGYGLPHFKDLFTTRQLVMLTTLSDLVPEARDRAISDGATKERADAIAVYLALSASKSVDNNSTLCSWMSGLKYEVVRNTFSRQALPMTWDYAECNPFAESSGDFFEQVKRACLVLELAVPASGHGSVEQLDAAALKPDALAVFCTDPPYYDNIGYADLSDFFYIWLRRALQTIYPTLFSTLLVPKAQELVATPYRFGGSREKAQAFFEAGFVKAFGHVRSAQEPSYPLTIFYAFKQSEETDEEGGADSLIASTGWETMLEGLLQSAFQVTGTWPMRSERSARTIAVGTNALASSIVLVCRPRSESAPITTRRDFLSALKKELPHALRNLQKGNIAPVDLAQAAIGPGMAVFSRYKKVLETDGSAMRVRTALALINQGLDEVLSEQESEFDPDTRWALAWFEQNGFEEGTYGEAEVLATAKALSVAHLSDVGIVHSRAGKVRLLGRQDLSDDWDPSNDARLTVWEVTQHLIRRLDKHGEAKAEELAARVGGLAEIARDLAYRLYTLCERKGWATEAGYYNSLVISWPSIAPKAFELL